MARLCRGPFADTAHWMEKYRYTVIERNDVIRRETTTLIMVRIMMSNNIEKKRSNYNNGNGNK